ncbi:MAG TPA: hypothetical protein VFB72_13030, partial [Verrucomicrobiae bacterium]|nr:hypothetical protein [Verrucomicrobiae bacterium]
SRGRRGSIFFHWSSDKNAFCILSFSQNRRKSTSTKYLQLSTYETASTYKLVPPPANLWPDGAGGRIDACGYFFSFGTRYRYIIKRNPFAGETQAEENELLSHGTSLIDKNGAFLLASNWLEEIQVYVPELEKAHPHRVRQRTDNLHGLLPVFHVEWGERQHPMIEVVVDGRNKSLVSIRQEDTSFCKRPAELVRNLDKLLEIPDEEFNNYSDAQRSHLLSQYSVVDYYHDPFRTNFSLTNRYAVTNDYKTIMKKYSSAALAKRRLQRETTGETNTP